ncbi:MAG: antitoxin family protein [Anaerolinea sp.]|nr:antitoxin family protein [Anaerolinea sp.]
MVVKALYHDGLLKPIKPIDLADGEWVELEITRRVSRQPANIISLKGIWNQHSLPADEDDWVSAAIAEIRRETNLKLERLAAELSEALAND